MILWQDINKLEMDTGVPVTEMSLDDFIGFLYDFGYISSKSE